MSTEQQPISRETIYPFVNKQVRVRARWLSKSIIGRLDGCLCNCAVTLQTENGIFVVALRDITEISPMNEV
jgi:hypothetical protein